MHIISALGRLRQEDLEFKGSLGYRIRVCLMCPPPKTVGNCGRKGIIQI
jgi:hypothetical protein